MSPPPLQKGWQTDESGYDFTTATEIIQQTLQKLQEKRVLLVVLHKGYQSGSTVLVEHTDRHLAIDKPVDWPGKESVIRIVYKDAAKLWNHFTVKVIGTKDDLLYTTLPAKLFRLQRRAHFRVETPRHSSATFRYQKNSVADVMVTDISAGGMHACSKSRLPFAGERESIKTIRITLPATADITETTLTIGSGEVVRTSRNEEQCLYCYGIIFAHSKVEEEQLLKYVRQRELELLRAGLTF